jgi:hypothetical protein
MARGDADDARAQAVVARQRVPLLAEQRCEPPRHVAVANQEEVELCH